MEPPMTVKELSEYLRLDRMTIYKMLKEGSIPASRIGHQWRFFKDDIDGWIRSRRIGKKVSVLVADSGEELQQVLEAELSSETLEIVVAADGEEAAALASKRSFDLAFVGLSKGNIETFKRLRSVDAHVPVVVLAGPADGKLVDHAMDVGTFTLMRKPVSGEDVKRVLKTAVTNGSATA